MDIIVLAKFVADVEDVPPDAWDLETGTLKRGRLRMVTNPLDNHALQAARELREHHGGRIVVLSMGPESAEAVCRRAIAYGADDAILVTDRAFAGADTLATARVLAAAVQKATASLEIKSPLILAGMQSPDGDTAQVPAELAAILDIPMLPYVTFLAPASWPLEFKCLETTGHSEYVLSDLPALATVTSYTPELSFHTTMEGMFRGAGADIRRWGAEDLGLPPAIVGLSGSATRVVKIESVSSRRERRCTVALTDRREASRDMAALVNSLDSWIQGPGANSSTEGTSPETEEAPNPAVQANSDLPEPPENRRAPVFCVVEEGPRGPTSGSLELLGTARLLADSLQVPAVALRIDPRRGDSAAALLAEAGAHRILAIRATDKSAGYPKHHRLAQLLVEAVHKKGPQIVLAPASPEGRVVAPLAAAQLGAGLTADCTGLAIADYLQKRGNRLFPGVLHQTRPALGGNILATIVSVNGNSDAPQMATVRAGVFTRRSFPTDNAVVEELTVSHPLEAMSLRRTNGGPDTDRPGDPTGSRDRGSAGDIVVSVGVGIGTRERLEELVRPVISAMEQRWQVTVELACSRAAVEARILPYSYQIGQTGRTVRPELYVALGISGAIQHRLGMQGSGAILAVNPDPDAEIMAISDFAVLARLEEALPLFTHALQNASDSK